MHSAARRRQWFANIAPFIPRPRYVSAETCDRVDVVDFLPTLTRQERELGLVVRVLPGGVRVVLKAKERWPGARFFFFACPNPACVSALRNQGREYLLRLPDAPPQSWGCRACLPVAWVTRRYGRSSPARARATPLHRVKVRLARERRKRERETLRVDRLLAPIVHGERQRRAEKQARERREATELALAVAREVAEQGEVEVALPQRERLSLGQLRAKVRAARRRAEEAKRLSGSESRLPLDGGES